MRGPRPKFAADRRIVGPAFTLRFVPAREDLATPESWASPRSTRGAIEDMPEGCVAIADAMGVTDAGIFGDILAARMHKRGFDVQQDHAELIIGASRLLTRTGTIVFSCNLRGFKPDMEKLEKAGIELEDITASTIPRDFERNAMIHHCYLARRFK